MKPTYSTGSWVRINPLVYFWGTPHRGEIVALRSPVSAGRLELKRVLGLPGERISWMGSDIWINGTRLVEPYARKPQSVPGDTFSSLRLKRGQYFVAGDNRHYCDDSRIYGPVKADDIIGRAF